MTFTLDPKDDRVKYDGFRMTVAEDVISVVAKEPFGIVHSSYWALNRFGRIWWCDPECEPDFANNAAGSPLVPGVDIVGGYPWSRRRY